MGLLHIVSLAYWFLLQLHWNNPSELVGEMETSGVRIFYSPILREYDAETIFIGPLYLELPPMQSSVHQTSLCPGECTESMFPEPVYISNIIPHMHTAGL